MTTSTTPTPASEQPSPAITVQHEPTVPMPTLGQAAALTTLGTTVLTGARDSVGYCLLVAGPGEPHLVRGDITSARTRPSFALAAFAQMTDLHIVDDQSPLRVEFLDRYADPGPPGGTRLPTSAAYRAHESMSTHVVDAMCRALRAVARAPRSGMPLQFTVVSGDAVDNCQFNEVRWYIDLLDGGAAITPNSGHSFDHSVTGDSLGLDIHYWHPSNKAFELSNTNGPGLDLAFQAGFPEVMQLPDIARTAFTPTGLGMPWFAVFGNHDTLVQGNVPQFYDLFGLNLRNAAVGNFKRTGIAGLPPDGPLNLDDLVALAESAIFQTFAGVLVPADADRRLLDKAAFVAEHWMTRGIPSGHGFQTGNGPTYYVAPGTPEELVRHVMLDTTNALGGANGVIFDDQWQWLIQVLKAGSSRYLSDDPHNPTIVEHPGVQDVLFVIHCHHTISTMDNGIFPPDTTFYDGHALENLLLRFPNVILMVDGHNHKNTITAHQRPWAGTVPGGFWEVTTASHIDWPIQSRLLEITSGGGVISVFTTLMDPDAPLDWRDENLHTPKGLASLARELTANDLQQRDHGVLSRPGHPEDRNVQLLLPAPFALPDPPIFGSPVALVAARHGTDSRLLVSATDNADQALQGVIQETVLELTPAGQPLRSIGAALNADGRVEIFGVDPNGTPWHRWQLTPNVGGAGPWSDWTALPGRLSSIAVTRAGDGRLHVIGSDTLTPPSPDALPGGVWQASQTTPGATTLTDWTPLAGGELAVTAVATATNADGRVELFAITYHGAHIIRGTQTAPGSWIGTQWQLLDQMATSIALTSSTGGALHAFASGEDGQVFHSRQDTPGGTWRPWTQFDTDTTWAAYNIRQLAATNSDGFLTLLGLDADGQTLLRTQGLDPDTFGPWRYLTTRQLRTAALPTSRPSLSSLTDQTSMAGAPIALDLPVHGGTPPYTWTITNLPAGIAADPNGHLHGTADPTGKGTNLVTVTVTDTNHLTSASTFTWRILAPVPDITGLRETPALADLRTAHFTWTITIDNSCIAPVGFVANQDPTPGELLPIGSPVHVWISSGHDTQGKKCILQ
jgi:metallophosphoesterase (TIGR03767 family)